MRMAWWTVILSIILIISGSILFFGYRGFTSVTAKELCDDYDVYEGRFKSYDSGDSILLVDEINDIRYISKHQETGEPISWTYITFKSVGLNIEDISKILMNPSDLWGFIIFEGDLTNQFSVGDRVEVNVKVTNVIYLAQSLEVLDWYRNLENVALNPEDFGNSSYAELKVGDPNDISQLNMLPEVIFMIVAVLGVVILIIGFVKAQRSQISSSRTPVKERDKFENEKPEKMQTSKGESSSKRGALGAASAAKTDERSGIVKIQAILEDDVKWGDGERDSDSEDETATATAGDDVIFTPVGRYIRYVKDKRQTGPVFHGSRPYKVRFLDDDTEADESTTVSHEAEKKTQDSVKVTNIIKSSVGKPIRLEEFKAATKSAQSQPVQIPPPATENVVFKAVTVSRTERPVTQEQKPAPESTRPTDEPPEDLDEPEEVAPLEITPTEPDKENGEIKPKSEPEHDQQGKTRVTCSQCGNILNLDIPQIPFEYFCDRCGRQGIIR